MGEFVPGRSKEGLRLAGSISEDDRSCLGVGNTDAPMGDTILGQRVEVPIRADHVYLRVRNGNITELVSDLLTERHQLMQQIRTLQNFARRKEQCQPLGFDLRPVGLLRSRTCEEDEAESCDKTTSYSDPDT